MENSKHISFVLYAMGMVLIFSCEGPSRLPDRDWAAFGHDLSNSKFADLDDINLKTVNSLQPVWYYEDPRPNGGSVLFNPLVVQGRMYAFTPTNSLVCLNARTGESIWEFFPDRTSVQTWIKGITYHRKDMPRDDVLLFVFGETLYSVNASNGSLTKDFGTKGKVDFYEGLSIEAERRSQVHVTVNAPGVVYGDLFIVGSKVPDELPSAPGDIRAFNVNTGALEWVFHTIPKKGEFGADTWPENARENNGGANCWGGMALDPERGIVYVPTASPSFDFYGADREGTNLFANCLLALDAKTGERIWHFQTTHHDLWDRDNGSPPNLVSVLHEGAMIDAVALVTKMGYVFLFDRETGDPLFPIEEIPVDTLSIMPGERPWPTQPIPTKPDPFARQGFREEFYSTLTPEINQEIREDIKRNNYSTGIYQPPSLNGSIILPTAHGGANWGGASFNPRSKVLFVNSSDLPWILKLTEIEGLRQDNDLGGRELYQKYCGSCHGAEKRGTNYGPGIEGRMDSYTVGELEEFLKRGAEPMPSFKHLPQVQINAIISYLKEIEVGDLQGADGSQPDSGYSQPYGFSGYNFYLDKNGNPAIEPPYGTLTAIDLNKGEILWQSPLGEDENLAKQGISNSGLFNRGGGIATSGGLIFIAATADRMLRAFDQKNGKEVWKTKLPGSGYSIPSTYRIDGIQYLTVGVAPNPESNFNGGYVTYSIK